MSRLTLKASPRSKAKLPQGDFSAHIPTQAEFENTLTDLHQAAFMSKVLELAFPRFP